MKDRKESARVVGLSMYLTVDGYNEFPAYPGSEPSADEPDLVAEEMWVKRWDRIDTLLFDLRTYEEWSDFWPIAKRTAGEHPWFQKMSEFAERVQKVVLSESTGPTSWAHTRFVPGDVGEAVQGIRKESGGMIMVVAPRLGMELIRRGLVDDFFFAVMPVVLGSGRRFFEELKQQQTLRLLEVKSFETGTLFLHYEAVR